MCNWNIHYGKITIRNLHEFTKKNLLFLFFSLQIGRKNAQTKERTIIEMNWRRRRLHTHVNTHANGKRIGSGMKKKKEVKYVTVVVRRKKSKENERYLIMMCISRSQSTEIWTIYTVCSRIWLKKWKHTNMWLQANSFAQCIHIHMTHTKLK